MSRFIIRKELGRSAKDYARKIFKVLKKNMFDKYEMHAFEKLNIVLLKEV